MSVARVCAWLCVFAGLGALAVAGYQVLDPGAAHRQATLQNELSRIWRAQPSPSASTAKACSGTLGYLPAGQPFALMTIPRLGQRWRFAVVEGTGDAQLALGPGHIAGTSLPGGANFAVAAHVITAGNPFMHLTSLRSGDLVHVRTRRCLYTYQVSGRPFKVNEHDVGVLREYPGVHRITLITCWPITLNATPWRAIVYGALVSERSA